MDSNTEIEIVLNQISECSEDSATKRYIGESVSTRYITFSLWLCVEYFGEKDKEFPLFRHDMMEEIHYCCCKKPEKLANGANGNYSLSVEEESGLTFTIFRETQKPIKLSGKYVKWLKKVINTVNENLELPTAELVKKLDAITVKNGETIIDTEKILSSTEKNNLSELYSGNKSEE